MNVFICSDYVNSAGVVYGSDSLNDHTRLFPVGKISYKKDIDISPNLLLYNCIVIHNQVDDKFYSINLLDVEDVSSEILEFVDFVYKGML